MIRQFFSFFRRPDNLGTGVSNLALVQPNGPPRDGMYADRSRMVRGSLSTTATPGFMMWHGYVVPVALEGNGTFLTGQNALQSLVKMEGKPGQ